MVQIDTNFILNYDKQINLSYDNKVRENRILKIVSIVLFCSLFSLMLLELYHFCSYH